MKITKILITFNIILIISCTTSRHVDTNKTRIIDNYQAKQNYNDSVIIYDSVSVKYHDSIQIVYHYIDRYKVKNKTDSVIINDTITIYQELSTENPQYNKQNNKKSSSNNIFVLCICMLLICIIIYKRLTSRS